ncbi:hypothetical protein, partial [Klebsiella pneumoniae]|uniref:hypothetical protein n=1 Tax=Klebsiella pneumoniae TaxID=573 RepID=UPI0039C030B2
DVATRRGKYLGHIKVHPGLCVEAFCYCFEDVVEVKPINGSMIYHILFSAANRFFTSKDL